MGRGIPGPLILVSIETQTEMTLFFYTQFNLNCHVFQTSSNKKFQPIYYPSFSFSLVEIL